MRQVHPLTVSCLLLLTGLLSGCAARDAGFGSLRELVGQRAPLEPRWNHLDGPADATVAALLRAPVGAEEAVRIALLNNAGLQAAFEDLGLARAALLEAGLPPNIEIEGERSRVPGERAEFSFAATTDVSRLVFLPLRRRAATAELDAVRFRTAGVVLDFAHSVRTSFYQYQVAEQLLELDRTVLEAAAASYDVAQRLYDAGNITALELANEQAFYEEARSRATLAEGVALTRREQLNGLMGFSGTQTAWKLAGRLGEPGEEPPGPAELEAQSIRQSLDLAELEHRYQAAARRANLARAEGLLPSLHAGVHLGREEGLREFGPVIGVELPLFDRGQGRIERARAEMRQLEHQYGAMAVRIRAAVRSAQTELVIAAGRVAHYRDVLLPLRERIVEQTQRQYNAMELGVFQLIVSRREQIRTAQEYVLALGDYWRLRAALDQILAGRLVPVGGNPGEAMGRTAGMAAGGGEGGEH